MKLLSKLQLLTKHFLRFIFLLVFGVMIYCTLFILGATSKIIEWVLKDDDGI